MAETSIFWTTGATGDGATAYTQAQCILWLRRTFCGADNEGVLKDYLNELATTGASSPVATNTGGAYIHGFPYDNSTSVDTAIATPSGNTRIDRLVLRANWSAQTVRITRIAGTEGSGTPPALVQTDGTTWDNPLYQASITTGGVITLTDEREFIHPNIAVDGDMIDDDAVDSQHYTDGSIDLAHMSANSIDSAQYVDGSIDRVHLAADIVDGTKIDDDAIDSEHYAAGSIDLEHMSANSVDSGQYVDGSIDLAHMSANSIDSGQYVDGSIDTAHLANLQVTLAKLAADSVDDTKAGNRIPQFRRRQGGSATLWETVGDTDYTPTAVRIQAGCKQWTGAANTSGATAVTLPTAFSYEPLIFATGSGTDSDINVAAFPSSASAIVLYWKTIDGSQKTEVNINWLAIGPE